LNLQLRLLPSAFAKLKINHKKPFVCLPKWSKIQQQRNITAKKIHTTTTTATTKAATTTTVAAVCTVI